MQQWCAKRDSMQVGGSAVHRHPACRHAAISHAHARCSTAPPATAASCKPNQARQPGGRWEMACSSACDYICDYIPLRQRTQHRGRQHNTAQHSTGRMGKDAQLPAAPAVDYCGVEVEVVWHDQRSQRPHQHRDGARGDGGHEETCGVQVDGGNESQDESRDESKDESRDAGPVRQVAQ